MALCPLDPRIERRHILAEGTPDQLTADPDSIMGPYLAGTATVRRDRAAPGL